MVQKTNTYKMDSETVVQWLWLDMGGNQIARQILEWDNSPVINLVDKQYFTFINLHYLSTLPFMNLKLPDGNCTTISSTTPLKEIIRWAKVGRSGAGASDIVGIGDVAAYFKATLLPIMLSQSGVNNKLLKISADTSRIVVAPIGHSDEYDMQLSHYINQDEKLKPTLYMAVINMSPILSRCWLQNRELLYWSKSMLIDMLPGLERSQIYGPPCDRYSIKDCLTTVEFNLFTAIWSYYSSKPDKNIEKIKVPITITKHNGLTEARYGDLYLVDVFNHIMTYAPNFMVVWSNYSCRDTNSDPGVSVLQDDEDYISSRLGDISIRDDKKICNKRMLQQNAVLNKMMRTNMHTYGERKRHEIVRTPLFNILEKSRDKDRRAIYRAHCGSSSYHYITNTGHYRKHVISTPSKSCMASDTMIDQLSQQLNNSNLGTS